MTIRSNVLKLQLHAGFKTYVVAYEIFVLLGWVRSVDWQLVTDVYGRPIGSIFKVKLAPRNIQEDRRA
jgi:hypothetical protein